MNPGFSFLRICIIRFSLGLTVLPFLSPVLADAEAAKFVGRFDSPISKQGVFFGVGTSMTVEYGTDRIAKGTFLGRLIDMRGQTKRYMFFDSGAKKAFLLDPSETRLEYANHEVQVRDLQAIAEPIEQYDNTCSAYAVVYFLRQLHLNGFHGTGRLAEMLGSPEGVANLMARAMNDYYLNPRTASFQVVYRKLADEVGMDCREVNSKSPARFVDLLENSMISGSPVLLEFQVGQDMIVTDHQWRDLNKPRGEDRRLWVPRASGERNSGGHAIVVDAVFSSPTGRLKFLIGDSDWGGAPRIWDVERFLVERKETGHITAHVCFERSFAVPR